MVDQEQWALQLYWQCHGADDDRDEDHGADDVHRSGGDDDDDVREGPFNTL